MTNQASIAEPMDLVFDEAPEHRGEGVIAQRQYSV